MGKANLYQPYVVDFESRVMSSQESDGGVGKTNKDITRERAKYQGFQQRLRL